MSQGASPYPIQQVLLGLIDQYGPSSTEFVQTLGYSRHVDRALHRLGLWLSDGEGYDKIIGQIAWKYPQHADGLYQAISATKEMKAAEARAAFLDRCRAEVDTFTPFIHAEGEVTVPRGITLFGISGGFRRWTIIQIPRAILDLPLQEQLAALPPLMLDYRERNNGYIPFFGELRGFKFVRCLDYFQFDGHAHLIEHVDKPYRNGYCWVEFR